MKITDIIESFGSQAEMARCIGLKQPNVFYWTKSGKIPTWRHADIIAAAKKRGIALTREDLEGAK